MVQKTGKSQITFIFKPEEGHCEKVAIAGSFNNWEPSLGKMVKQKDGTYRKRLELTPGEHRYKFYVDGQWITDMQAEFCVPNPFGTLDSLLVVK